MAAVASPSDAQTSSNIVDTEVHVDRVDSSVAGLKLTAAQQQQQQQEEPLVCVGVVADVQYVDLPVSKNFSGTETRYYRDSLVSVTQAAECWAQRGVRVAVQLGDLIDQQSRITKAQKENVEMVINLFLASHPSLELHHVFGNHEAMCFSREDYFTHFPGHYPHASAPHEYHYSFAPCPGFRFVVLDAYDVSTWGRAPGSDAHGAAVALIKANNPNECAWGSASGNFFTGLSGPVQRFCPFNGGIGAKQLAWLQATLEKACSERERVVLMSHALFKALPHDPDSNRNLIFNYDEIEKLVLSVNTAEFKTVVATFCGHSHTDDYVLDDSGIHHVVLGSPMIYPLSGGPTFGTLELYPDRLELRGSGGVASRTLPF